MLFIVALFTFKVHLSGGFSSLDDFIRVINSTISFKDLLGLTALTTLIKVFFDFFKLATHPTTLHMDFTGTGGTGSAGGSAGGSGSTGGAGSSGSAGYGKYTESGEGSGSRKRKLSGQDSASRKRPVLEQGSGSPNLLGGLVTSVENTAKTTSQTTATSSSTQPSPYSANTSLHDSESIRRDKLRLSMLPQKDTPSILSVEDIRIREHKALVSSALIKLEILADYNKKNRQHIGTKLDIPEYNIIALTDGERSAVLNQLNNDPNAPLHIKCRT
jgi:hypothetical protein